MNNPEQRKQELLAELAKVEQEIERAKPKLVFERDEEYWYPRYIPWANEIVCADFEHYSNPEATHNPRNLLIFKTKEQCESFNKKLLALAEREARINYGVIQKPESPDFSQIVVYTINGDDRTIHDLDQWLELRDYCNQYLDYQEQKEVRGE